MTGKATPAKELELQIMSSMVPKNEREHWAAREIDRLRAELAAAREILRGCWIQCDTFKKPVMCWDMYHALEKWAAKEESR